MVLTGKQKLIKEQFEKWLKTELLNTWVDQTVIFWYALEGLPPEVLRHEIEGEKVNYVFKVTCEDQYGNRTSKTLTMEQMTLMHINQNYKKKHSTRSNQLKR